jgi:tetraacyldisaccharide 4'-kinase
LRRADAIVLPAGLSVDHLISRRDAACRVSIDVLPQKPVWRIERTLVLPYPLSAPIVFCGIARPQQFFAQVRAAGILPAAEVEFRDHHAYVRSDIQRLLAMRAKLGPGGFLTTEKDAVNLGPLQEELKPFTIAVLSLTIDHPNDAVDSILDRTIFATIAKPKPRS